MKNIYILHRGNKYFFEKPPYREDDGTGLWVFHPTLEVMASVPLHHFVQDLMRNSNVRDCGGIKIVPPPTYKARPDDFITKKAGTSQDVILPLCQLHLKKKTERPGVLDHFSRVDDDAPAKNLSSFFDGEVFVFTPVGDILEKVCNCLHIQFQNRFNFAIVLLDFHFLIFNTVFISI